MKMSSFNKKDDTVLCMYCKRNRVSSRDWKKPCEKCKLKLKKKKSRAVDLGAGNRLPAAVWKDEEGNEIVVDKFGKPIQDHGYDFENDPRGYKKAGKKGNRKDIII